MATVARTRARRAGAPGREDGEALPERGRPAIWPTGLIGALGLILLVDGIIARIPGEVDRGSRLESSWQSAVHTASDPALRAEIFCFGDSLIKLGILPRVLEARLGRSAYNLAVLGGQPPTSHYLLRRVLDRGHSPRALVVDFSPLLLGMDPRAGLASWAGLPRGRERLDLIVRARNPGLAASLVVHGVLGALARRDAFRAALGWASFDAEDGGERPEADELRALLRNWHFNRGAQVAPRGFVAIAGACPRAYDGSEWRWQPHPVHAYFVDRFLATAQDRGIPVYWIIPPAEAGWLDRNERVGTLGAYRRYVRNQLSRFPALTVLDMQRAGWDRAWFRDPIHLNRDGAIRLSLAVADAMAQANQVTDYQGRWIELNGDRSIPTRRFQDLLEDLDQSRLAVCQGESSPITMEGPRR